MFTGNAKEAIATFPRRVNVAVATSLATTGPEITDVTMHSVPNWVGDDHRHHRGDRRREGRCGYLFEHERDCGLERRGAAAQPRIPGRFLLMGGQTHV